MPNWVVNRLKITGPNASEIIKSHIVKEENGEDLFDFNTVVKMPEDLNIEKSSKSHDGMRLYISSLCPLNKDVTGHDQKMDMKTFAETVLSVFGEDIYNHLEKYILKNGEIDSLKEKYGSSLGEVMELGEKAFHNKEKYGYTEWYGWALDKWGTKWNACNTMLSDDLSEVYFDTAWSPAVPVVEAFAKLHPELKVVHDYAEEQTGFYSGHYEYENGEAQVSDDFEAFTKEAYEMSFELWGNEESYVFDSKTNNYVYKEDYEEESCL